jgi:thymidylate synthase ThyX
MKNKSRIYVLDSQEYSPETIAVAFAKTSRSPESFDQIANELTEQKSAEFNEKWVVGYGHSSVAEHAVLHLAIENVSRLAVECLESNRLASYTEKSTRYQTWGSGAFFTPPELEKSGMESHYTELCDRLFDFYSRLIQKVTEVVAVNCPQKSDESDPAWKRRVQSTAVDSCRFVLPAAALANVGMTINARALEHALVKMLSSNLEEVRQMGAEIKSVAQRIVPTLVKYSEANPYVNSIEQEVQSTKLPPSKNEDWCKLITCTPDLQNRILAAVVYRFGECDYTQAVSTVEKMSPRQRAELVKTLFTNRDRFTAPLRELEHSSFTFDLIADQGAWYEIKRHRMLTLTTQPFNPHLGYTLPKTIDQAGCHGEYENLMEECIQFFPELEKVSNGLGAYILPNAFKRRFLISMNLRSAIHFINLRCAPNAHYSVRRVALRIAEQIQQALPEFAPHLFCPSEETWQGVEQEYFAKA